MTSPRDTAVYYTRKIDESGQVKARVVFEYEEVGSPQIQLPNGINLPQVLVSWYVKKSVLTCLELNINIIFLPDMTQKLVM